MKERNGMTTAEAGRIGGKKIAAERGPEYFKALGRIGGKRTFEKSGREYFSAIGRRGGQRTKQLVEAGKQTAERINHEQQNNEE